MNKQKLKIIHLQANAVRKLVSIVPDIHKVEPKSFYRLLYKARGENYRPRHAYQIASQQSTNTLASVFRKMKDQCHVEPEIPMWHWSNTFDYKQFIIETFVGSFDRGPIDIKNNQVSLSVVGSVIPKKKPD